MKQIKVAVIGGGNRGRTYTDRMKELGKDYYDVIAICDPDINMINQFKDKHDIKDEMCFTDYNDFFKKGKIADCVLVATMDDLHIDPALKAIELGYDILLEKPVCPNAEDCVKIANAAKEKGVKILVCHVLRYTPFFSMIKNLIDEGKVGEVQAIHHIECVGNLHQAHSFVRGNWHNSKKSSCMILQKCCHDLDIIQYLIGDKCKKISSFGSLSYFKEENAPEGAPLRCADGCPHADTCIYNAVDIYVKNPHNLWYKGAAIRNMDLSDEEMMEFLRTSDYGKCVFRSDNDVVDRQVVNLEFEKGAVATLSMNAFNHAGRFIRVMGTKGEIYGDMNANTVQYFEFQTRETIKYDLKSDEFSSFYDKFSGHGGGDMGIVKALYKYLTGEIGAEGLSEIGVSVENHLLSFAAEKARVEERIIKMDEYKKELGLKI